MLKSALILHIQSLDIVPLMYLLDEQGMHTIKIQHKYSNRMKTFYINFYVNMYLTD